MDLFVIEGTSRKYWGAAVDGKTLHTAWGRLGSAMKSKAASFASPSAARTAYDAAVAEKRKKGYLDARPRPGAPTFLAEDHAHADVVYLDPMGSVLCSVCDGLVDRVRVGAAPERAAPRAATTTAPKKKLPTTELKRELARIAKSAWNDALSARERAALDKREAELAAELSTILAANAGTTTPATELRPVSAIEVQAEALWPLATDMRDGTVLRASDLFARAAARFATTARGRKAFRALKATARPVWRAQASPGKAADGDRVGGSPAWLGPAQWPRCKTCKSEMVFVAQLSAGPGTPIPLAKGRRIFLFECEDHCYGTPGGGIVIQPNDAPPSPGKAPGKPLPPLRLTFERGVEHDNASMRDDASALETALATVGAEPAATKLGGYPEWIQTPSLARCPRCKKPMSFVAQLDGLMHRTTRDHPFWGDAGRFYLQLCFHDEVGHLELQMT